MLAAMDNDVATAASAGDPDATVDLRPSAHVPSHNRSLSSTDNKALPAVEPGPEATFNDVEPLADDTRDTTMDVADGECYFSSFSP